MSTHSLKAPTFIYAHIDIAIEITKIDQLNYKDKDDIDSVVEKFISGVALLNDLVGKRLNKLISLVKETYSNTNKLLNMKDNYFSIEKLSFIKENNIQIYNEKNNTGVFRHIIVKVGMATKQIMCILVVNEENVKKEKELIQRLKEKFSEIKTIVKNINNKNTNVILGNKNIILYGDGYIEDKLGGYTFKISPMSFYQINPIQTEKLYNLAIKKAELTGNETILDLYCGIGTIGIFASKYVKQVYGIEIIPQAIKDAKENAEINNIKNAEFMVGEVEIALSKLIQERKIIPEVVFVDPPRKGLDNTTMKNLLKVEPQKIIYISCNPATLIRDLKIFEEKYEIKDIMPVDMFPWTKHVETISVLEIK